MVLDKHASQEFLCSLGDLDIRREYHGCLVNQRDEPCNSFFFKGAETIKHFI